MINKSIGDVKMKTVMTNDRHEDMVAGFRVETATLDRELFEGANDVSDYCNLDSLVFDYMSETGEDFMPENEDQYRVGLEKFEKYMVNLFRTDDHVLVKYCEVMYEELVAVELYYQ